LDRIPSGVEPRAAVSELEGRLGPHLVDLDGPTSSIVRETEKHSGFVFGHRDLLPLLATPGTSIQVLMPSQ
jgi:hypothetical protein